MSSLVKHTLTVSSVFAWFERRDGRALVKDDKRKFYTSAGYLDYVGAYGEPGYSAKRGIFFANWNIVPKAICQLLEREGFDYEWSDEWYVDHENDKAYRTQPDSHGWTTSITITEDGEILTPDAIDRDPDAFIKHLVNAPRRCMTPNLRINLAAHGFMLAETDKETGLLGLDDDPVTTLSTILAAEPDAEVIFEATGVGQFDVACEVWTRLPSHTEGKAAA